MKKALVAAAVIIIALLAYSAVTLSKGPASFQFYSMNIKVPGLLKQPVEGSEDAFTFPIDVRLTGVSTDKKWFRFKVSYDLVFFGNYEYEGWCRVDPWQPFENGATPEVIELK